MNILKKPVALIVRFFFITLKDSILKIRENTLKIIINKNPNIVSNIIAPEYPSKSVVYPNITLDAQIEIRGTKTIYMGHSDHDGDNVWQMSLFEKFNFIRFG